MTGEELEEIVERCLTEGVPPGVVARVFDLDPELCKQAQSGCRVKRYNTDDMGEYMEILLWETVEDALRTLKVGSAAERRSVHQVILGKQVALAARRTPESVRNSQDAVIELMESMRSGPPRSPAPKSKFIARLDDADTG